MQRIEPEAAQLVELINDLTDILNADRNLTERLRDHRRTLIKWYCQTYGSTVRECAVLFGVPKTTIHKWLTGEGRS